jgi:hypothetical protein
VCGGGRGNTDLLPAGGIAALPVLDQKMRSPDASLGNLDALGLDVAPRVRAVMVRHVVLELVGVGALGWLPAGNSFYCVEVVGEVLAVAVADLPVGRETSLRLEGIVRSWVSFFIRLCAICDRCDGDCTRGSS